MKDINGRAYALNAELKAGDSVEVDSDFTCLSEGSTHIVHSDEGDLHIYCKYGNHFLDGQLSGDEAYYVGLYKI